jgi:hypothetical protein
LSTAYLLDHIADNTVSLTGTTVIRGRTVSEDLESGVSLNVVFAAKVVLNGTVDLGDLEVVLLKSSGCNFIFRSYKKWIV